MVINWPQWWVSKNSQRVLPILLLACETNILPCSRKLFSDWVYEIVAPVTCLWLIQTVSSEFVSIIGYVCSICN
jgi:hypothetical protein